MTWNIGPKFWSKTSSTNDNHLEQAKTSLKSLLDDKRLNQQARERLGEEYKQLQRHLEKLERGDVHVAVFGRVSVGKSALLNALLGKSVFSTSVLHGETKNSQEALWQTYDSGGVYLIDTPGIDEINGDERTLIAEKVASRADAILFVIDADMTLLEYEALQALKSPSQPIIIVLNKCDRLSASEQEKLIAHLRNNTNDEFPIVATSAEADEYIEIDAHGKEHLIRPEANIAQLQETLWQILREKGHTYAALNAAIFAEQLSLQVGAEIVAARKGLAEQVIHKYALMKALGVAINPIPAADLLALAADFTMIIHLSNVYNIELTQNEARQLLTTIATQTGMLMLTVYGVHFLSSALKGLSAGLSTVLTASAQGGVAFYGSVIIGKAAETYFSQGATWGENGVKKTIERIMQDLDKEALLQEAKSAIKQFKNKD